MYLKSKKVIYSCLYSAKKNYLCLKKQENTDMNTKNILLFCCWLLLGTTACTRPPAPSEQGDVETWRAAVEHLLNLEKSNRNKEALVYAHQLLPELIEASETTGKKDSLIRYAGQAVNLCHYAYLHTRQHKAGISYMDSIRNIPFIRDNFPYQLLCSRACLNQLAGNNEEAIRLADEYRKLPPCEDLDEFIRQAETISGVYFYSGNDVPQAIQLLEQAMEAYRKGGKFQNMLRLISRLGIYYRLSGEYEKAAATNQEAIDTYNDSISPQNIVIAYGEQANLYADLEMYDRALQMSDRAKHYSLMKDSFGLGDIYRYRADIFRQTGQKDSMFYYLYQGEAISKRQNSFKGVFVNKVNIADACLDCDSTTRALQLLQEVAPDVMRMPPWAQMEYKLQLGRVLLKTGQEKKGIALMEEASQGYARMGMTEFEYNTNEQLMDYYREHGENDALVRCYLRNDLFADSLRSNEKMRAVAAANIRFETLQKEKENKLLSAQVQLQQQQLFYHICISIILLLLLASTTAYFIIRRKANRQVIENNRREIQALITRQQDLNRRNEQLTEQIEKAEATNNLTAIRQLTVQTLLSKEDETVFRHSFATLHPSYLPRLREHYPQLTRNEELLAMLICINQSTDEIALILGINRNSVNVVRSRMRKNMNLSKEESLDDVLKQYLA